METKQILKYIFKNIEELEISLKEYEGERAYEADTYEIYKAHEEQIKDIKEIHLAKWNDILDMVLKIK